MARVDVSLPKIAEHGRVSGTYNDGWGLGYYEGEDVRLVKDSADVGDSEWAPFIASHILRSQWRRTGRCKTQRRRYAKDSSSCLRLLANSQIWTGNFLYSDGDMLFAHAHRRKRAETGKIEALGLASIQR